MNQGAVVLGRQKSDHIIICMIESLEGPCSAVDLRDNMSCSCISFIVCLSDHLSVMSRIEAWVNSHLLH